MTRRYWLHQRTADVLASSTQALAYRYEAIPFLAEVHMLTSEQLAERDQALGAQVAAEASGLLERDSNQKVDR